MTTSNATTTSNGNRHRPPARRGGGHGRRTGRGAVVGVAVLLLGTVLLTAGASAAPTGVVPPFVSLVRPEPARRTEPVTLVPVNVWEDRFLEAWEYELETAIPLSRSPDSWDHYTLSYDVDGNTAMFRATGRTRYLDRALEYAENVVATARPSASLSTSQYQDDYRGWVSLQRDLNRPGIEVPLYESYLWRYITTLLRVMQETPSVADDPAYRDRYQRLLDFAEVHVFEKWYVRGQENIYRSRTHMAAHWALIALNLSLITTDPDRRARYRQVVDDIDQHLPNLPSSLREQLRRNPVDPSAWFWDDAWGSYRRPGQDVSHGNGVIAYLVEARDRGGYWTDADLAGFESLLVNVIWPGGRTYRNFVDGSGTGNGWFSDGFVKLGRYDPAVQQRLDRHAVVNSHFAANMALNAAILS